MRCGHASGTDESYIRAALSAGFDELGFSDHVPWPSGYVNPTVRMTMGQLDGYVRAVRDLKEEFKDRISVRLGFEAEYFPAYIGWLSEMKEQYALDYLILGNHFEESDEYGMYYGNCKRPEHIVRYVNMTIKGLETGLFSYLAHPDLFLRAYPGGLDASGRDAARDLSDCCLALDIPMEYNLHDRYLYPMTHRISYPDREFFDIVREKGVRVITGVDAHEPAELSDTTQWDRAQRELEAFGEKKIDRLLFRD